MVLTLLVSLKQSAQRDVLEPSVRSLPKLHAALDRAAECAGWDELAVNRLAGEEAFLLPARAPGETSKPQPVRVSVRPVDASSQIELVAGPDDVNLEDRLSKLNDDHEIARDVGPGRPRGRAELVDVGRRTSDPDRPGVAAAEAQNCFRTTVLSTSALGSLSRADGGLTDRPPVRNP